MPNIVWGPTTQWKMTCATAASRLTLRTFKNTFGGRGRWKARATAAPRACAATMPTGEVKYSPAISGSSFREKVLASCRIWTWTTAISPKKKRTDNAHQGPSGRLAGGGGRLTTIPKKRTAAAAMSAALRAQTRRTTGLMVPVVDLVSGIGKDHLAVSHSL